jgi:mRNA interferase RelE/StbE
MLIYDVILTKTAQKLHEKLPSKLREGVDRCLNWLETSPKKGPNIRRLEGQAGYFRYQVGGWRIVYRVEDETGEVRVYDIRPRGDVYKH